MALGTCKQVLLARYASTGYAVRMREPTVGIQKLDAWMIKTKTTQEMLAEKIGASQQSISAYLKKGRPVPLRHAVALEKLTKIRVEDFVAPSDSGTDVAAGVSRAG